MAGDGAVDVPAHPEGSSFNPNQLKDVQTADPGAKINLIEPPTPSITIDTRWGVPRYDGGLETETHRLNGEELTPVAHRTQLTARSAEKVFHTRVEGRFQRIVRHGDNPRNY